MCVTCSWHRPQRAFQCCREPGIRLLVGLPWALSTAPRAGAAPPRPLQLDHRPHTLQGRLPCPVLHSLVTLLELLRYVRSSLGAAKMSVKNTDFL